MYKTDRSRDPASLVLFFMSFLHGVQFEFNPKEGNVDLDGYGKTILSLKLTFTLLCPKIVIISHFEAMNVIFIHLIHVNDPSVIIHLCADARGFCSAESSEFRPQVCLPPQLKGLQN